MIQKNYIFQQMKAHKAPLLQREKHTLAAVALVCRQGCNGPEILFITRAQHPKDPWSGHIAFPGGRFESLDTHLNQTAFRETFEELNLDLSTHDYLGILAETSGRHQQTTHGVLVRCLVFWLKPNVPINIQANAEVEDYQWVSHAYLSNPTNQTHFALNDATPPFNAIRLPNSETPLWGMTYRFTQQFLAAVSKI